MTMVCPHCDASWEMGEEKYFAGACEPKHDKHKGVPMWFWRCPRCGGLHGVKLEKLMPYLDGTIPPDTDIGKTV